MTRPPARSERSVLKVVFDTVVFVRCLINPHSLWGRVVFSHYQDYQLFVSPPVLREILEVLRRPELTRKFRAFARLDVDRVLELLATAQVVEIPIIPSASRDLKDDKFLATGETGQVDYLVSEGQDLLVLKVFKGFKIIDTKSFLAILEAAQEANH